MKLHAGEVVAGKFELVREIGRGGMGSVWEARDRLLGRSVAIKFLHSDLLDGPDEGGVSPRARFEREARAAAGLRTRHVTQVFEFGFDAETPYIVLELLQGENLSDRLGRLQRLPLAAAVKIAVQTCRGLQQAHEAGIVHRDLKPGNLFFAQLDGEEVVKILDFGIAKVRGLTGLSEAHTGTGQIKGTPHYMSPEHIRGLRAEASTDLWSLAVIFYRCLAGVRPFEGISLGAVLTNICTLPPEPIRKRVPSLPAEVDAFLARALALDPARRYPTAVDFANALNALPLTADADVVAPPAGAPPPDEIDVTFSDETRTRVALAKSPMRPDLESATVPLERPTPVRHAPVPPSPVRSVAPEPLADTTTILAPPPIAPVVKVAVLVGMALGALILGALLHTVRESPSPASAATSTAAPR